MSKDNKKLPFKSWYKHTFTFSDGEDTLSFTPYYRSDITATISLSEAIAEGCENITFNGVEKGQDSGTT